MNAANKAYHIKKKVTKEFFAQYSQKYHELREFLENSPAFSMQVKRDGFTSEQFAKKLMWKTLFLYFLQETGWPGGDSKDRTVHKHKGSCNADVFEGNAGEGNGKGEGNREGKGKAIPASLSKGILRDTEAGEERFIRKLFERCIQKQENFFNNYLEPLFQNTLNINLMELGYPQALNCCIPSLPSGLIEPEDEYPLGLSGFTIPNTFFSNKKEKNDQKADGILDIFDRYSFTSPEDGSTEHKAAICPDMLGKTFGNLLENHDRKAKGTFYTPPEIVQYMCSKVSYCTLFKKRDFPKMISGFHSHGESMKETDISQIKNGGTGLVIGKSIYQLDPYGRVIVNCLPEIDAALEKVRIADLAVGAGAFVLGMLNEIVRIRRIITDYYSISMPEQDKHYMQAVSRHPY